MIIASLESQYKKQSYETEMNMGDYKKAAGLS